MARRFRYIIAEGFWNCSASDSTGISSGKPPADQHPAADLVGALAEVLWQQLMSLQVFTIAITGRPWNSSSGIAHLFDARAVTEPAQRIGAEPAMAAQLLRRPAHSMIGNC